MRVSRRFLSSQSEDRIALFFVARLLVVSGIVEVEERSWRKQKIHEQSENPLRV